MSMVSKVSLKEAGENALATLRNVLAAHGKDMTPADRRGRRKVIEELEAALKGEHISPLEENEAMLTIRIWGESVGGEVPTETGEVATALVPHLEHVTNLCGEGYVAGQIVDDAFTGWWDIKRG